MANVPTVPGSEIDVHTPERAVRLDANALNAPYRGAEAIAGAVEGAGDEASRLSSQLQKAKNAGVAADVDLRMRTARQTFIESLRNDQNESDWTKRAQETSDAVREDLLSEHSKIPPEMMTEVTSALRSWSGSLMTETQSLANQQTINRAWGKTKEDYVEKLRDGDAVGALHSLNLARATEIAPAHELDQLQRDIPRTIATNFIQNGLSQNPKGTTELLQSGGSLPANDENGRPITPSKVLSPREMTALINTGRVRTAAWQKNNAEEMLANDAEPVTGLIPESVVKDKMKSGEVSEQFGRNFLAAQERKVTADTTKKAADLAKVDNGKLAMVTAKVHDPVAWGNNPDVYAHALTEEAADISNPALRQRAISDINRQVAAVKKTGATAETPVQKRIYQQMNEDMATKNAMVPLSVEDVPEGEKTHSLGLTPFGGVGIKTTPGTKATTGYHAVPGGIEAVKKADFDSEATYGAGVSKDKVIEAIQTHNSRLQLEMSDWFKTPEGQKATFEQADQHRQEIERPYVMDSVRNTLSKKAPVFVESPSALKDLNLPPGAPFTTPDGTIRYAK